MSPKPILIIGGGLIGLCLAQGLKQREIPYLIFERDASLNHRGVGWAITLLWGLPFFRDLVPDHIYSRLKDVAVNPEAEEAGEAEDLTYFDMQSGKSLYACPDSANRIRVKRHGLREALLDGIDVQWSKELYTMDHLKDGSIQATFADKSVAVGSLLVGCDGSFSQLRKILLPETHATTPLPCRLFGTTVVLPRSVADPMRRLDPHYLQGGDSSQDIFFFFSFLDSPSNNSREERETYACQVFFGFPTRPPFIEELPESPLERVRYIKARTKEWAEPFQTIVKVLPEDTPLAEIRVQDWVPARRDSNDLVDRARVWDNLSGTVTLAGDAAHPMTMFRGEALNHGLYDLVQLLGEIEPLYLSGKEPTAGELKRAIDAYEAQMGARAHAAVLLSRRACMDAFAQSRVTATSPLVSERSTTSYLTQASEV